MSRLFKFLSLLLLTVILLTTPSIAQVSAEVLPRGVTTDLIIIDKICLQIGGVCTLELAVPPDQARQLEREWQANINRFQRTYFKAKSSSIELVAIPDDAEPTSQDGASQYHIAAQAPDISESYLLPIPDIDAKQRGQSERRRALDIIEVLRPAFIQAYEDRHGIRKLLHLITSGVFFLGAAIFVRLMENIKMRRDLGFGVSATARWLDGLGVLDFLECWNFGRGVLQTLGVPLEENPDDPLESDTIDFSIPLTLWIVQLGGTAALLCLGGWFLVIFPIRGAISWFVYNVLLRIVLPGVVGTGTAVLLNFGRRWWESGITANTSSERKRWRIKTLRSLTTPVIVICSAITATALAINPAALWGLAGLPALALALRLANGGGVASGLAIIKDDQYGLNDRVGLYTGDFERYVEGRVAELNLFWTVLITDDGARQIIRNSRVTKSKNYSLGGQVFEEIVFPFTADFLRLDEAEALLCGTLDALLKKSEIRAVLSVSNHDGKSYRLKPGKLGSNSFEYELIVHLSFQEHSPDTLEIIRRACALAIQEQHIARQIP
jgi:small-conductance mechanosensitive channel